MTEVNENAAAIPLLYDVLSTQANYRDAWIILGHSFLNERKWLDAHDALKKAIELDADNPSAFFFRGMALLNLNKPVEAINDFKKALALGWQPRVLAQQQLADSYFSMGNLDGAFPYYVDIVTTDPSDINRFTRPMAIAINHLNKPQEALRLAKKAFETHPNTASGFNLLGWAALANNDLTKARDYFQKSMDLDPEFAPAYLNRGQLEEKQGNIDEALRNYERAIELASLSGDIDIKETAQMRYNKLKEGGTENAQPPLANITAPASAQTQPPSLSLQ